MKSELSVRLEELFCESSRLKQQIHTSFGVQNLTNWSLVSGVISDTSPNQSTKLQVMIDKVHL